jgi:hypothetical protein
MAFNSIICDSPGPYNDMGLETGPTDSVVYLFYAVAFIAVLIYATQLYRISKKPV